MRDINFLHRFKNYIFDGLVSDKIRLDASTFCQLRCVLCPQAKGDLGIIGRGHLQFKNFKSLVGKSGSIRSIELSNYGEIFLNPEFEKILESASKGKLSLMAYNGVNLNTVKDSVLEALVKYGFKKLMISLDGTNDTTYTKYRVGGHYDTVIRNIKKLNEYKEKYNSEYPKLYWQFILFGHNENEMDVAEALAVDLHMDFVPKINWDSEFSPSTSSMKRRISLGGESVEILERSTLDGELWPCRQLWTEPQINWDGKMLGCCNNFWISCGNVFEDGLKKALQSEKLIYMKKMVQGIAESRIDVPCSRCNVYNKMKHQSMFFDAKKSFSGSQAKIISFSEHTDSRRLASFANAKSRYAKRLLLLADKKRADRNSSKSVPLYFPVKAYWSGKGEFNEALLDPSNGYHYIPEMQEFWDGFGLSYDNFGRDQALDISGFSSLELCLYRSNPDIKTKVTLKDRKKNNSEAVNIPCGNKYYVASVPLKQFHGKNDFDFSCVSEIQLDFSIQTTSPGEILFLNPAFLRQEP